ncbi:MAG: hypothetical protein ACJASL_000032 [Paraglaciecola sp.]|jgi:hypothetical protein
MFLGLTQYFYLYFGVVSPNHMMAIFTLSLLSGTNHFCGLLRKRLLFCRQCRYRISVTANLLAEAII